MRVALVYHDFHLEASLAREPDKRSEMAERGPGGASPYGEAAHALGMIEVYSVPVEEPGRSVGAS